MGKIFLDYQLEGNIITYGGPWWTVPELMFEKKQLIPSIQQLLVCHSRE